MSAIHMVHPPEPYAFIPAKAILFDQTPKSLGLKQCILLLRKQRKSKKRPSLQLFSLFTNVSATATIVFDKRPLRHLHFTQNGTTAFLQSPFLSPSTLRLAKHPQVLRQFLNDHLRSLKADQRATLTNTAVFATLNATEMHLSTVHNSNYYSGPANMTSTVNCFNMTMSSRIMRHCRPCTSLNGTNANSVYAGPSSTHLLARNIDDRQSQNTHTMAIVGIILGVTMGLLCCAALMGWAKKSNIKADKARKAALARRAARPGNGYAGGFSEKGSYQGDGGLDAPPRTARSHGTRFPVRSQPGHSDRSNQSRVPYADGSPFSAVAGFEEGGSQGCGRYNGTRGSSRRS